MRRHPARLLPALLNLGVTRKVKWPNLPSGRSTALLYRPWLEEHVGQQGIDWDWELTETDIATNQITLTFATGKEKWATIAALMWA